MSFPKKIGILGSGQLGAMLVEAGLPLGFSFFSFSPEVNPPTQKFGAIHTCGEYTDFSKLRSFLETVEITTFEFENIPKETLEFLEEYSKSSKLAIFPNPKSIRTSQNRILEKRFLNSTGVPTTEFYEIRSPSDLGNIPFPFPFLIKTTEMGYDGKGQYKIKSHEDLESFRNSHESFFHEAEKIIDFDFEASVIIARFQDGSMRSFEPSKNIHKKHILDFTIHPGTFSDTLVQQMHSISKEIVTKLAYVGVMGIEFFIKDEIAYVNEIAPRPHNSGHFSQEYHFSQFHLHLFAISNLEIPDIETSKQIVMKNILGDSFDTKLKIAYSILHDERYRLHLYQKETPKDNRKMGHMNFLGRLEEDHILKDL